MTTTRPAIAVATPLIDPLARTRHALRVGIAEIAHAEEQVTLRRRHLATIVAHAHDHAGLSYRQIARACGWRSWETAVKYTKEGRRHAQ